MDLVFQCLVANLAINSITNVVAYNAAVGKAVGRIDVPVLDPSVLENFGAVSLLVPRDSSARTESIEMTTLDQLQLSQCDLIKADVEGMERDVMIGASNTISNLKPYLYIESHDGPERAVMVNYLSSLGYDVYLHGTKLDPNLFCVHRERRVNVSGLQRLT